MIKLNITYEGVDITQSIEVCKADITDNAGGLADSVELVFSDTEKLWGRWKPKKGDRVVVGESGFSSGLMYVDQLEQLRGVYIIKALSIPQHSKTAKTKSWENVRFLEFSGEIARNYGFELLTYGIQNWSYSRVDQIEQTDFEFLAYRCILEGYILKICNAKVIIYNERYQEAQGSAKDIYPEDIDGDYEFRSVSAGLYSSCLLRSNSPNGFIQSEYKPDNPPAGPVLKKNIAVDNQAEADRFTRALLRYENKRENSGKIQIPLDSGLAAGNNIYVHGLALLEGKCFVEKIVHRLVDKKSSLKIRKPLEGY